jgi:hypothetical protein
MSEAALTVIDGDFNRDPPPAYAVSAITPMAMLSQAVERGMDPATIEKLMTLAEQWESKQARKAFDAAMSAAKAEIPVISKNKLVDFPTDNGRSRTTYRHEDLGEIARTVDPILAKHGLSYRYHTTSEINQPISVTCIVSHRDGHSEKNTLTGPRDDSGKKNAIQQMGSTLTYLQRYTLKAALGLAAAADDDGASSEDGPDVVTDDQVGELIELMDSVNADKPKFLEHFAIESVADLPVAKFNQAVTMLNAKRGRAVS